MMKNNGIRFGIIFVLIIITLVGIACEQHDNGEKLKTVVRSGIEFRQNRGVTDNQFEITVNKFNVVFYSDSFSDEERAQFKKHTNHVLIDYMSWGLGGGWFADSYDNSNFKLIISVPCDSIQSGIEKIIRSILKDIDEKYFDGGWHLE